MMHSIGPMLFARCWLLLVALPFSVCASEKNSKEWQATLAEARGQTVYWNAWGGDERSNSYIAWAAREVRSRFQVEVRHVKLGDTAEATSRVLAEKAAGKNSHGSVDLIWINGENFAALKEHRLLHGPFTDQLPNFKLVDTVNQPTLTDFTLPVDGLEAPWSMAQFVFHYDSARIAQPPLSASALLSWARSHPGRFTYPQPPDFVGTTFLKQMLHELSTNRAALYKPASEEEFVILSAPLWKYLGELHGFLWRKGRVFPANGPEMIRQLGDGEIDIAISFSPDTASSAIAEGRLPDTVRTFVLDGGTFANASFLAIPYNSNAKAGALVLIDFLLSPEAQSRKQDPRHLGAMTVLAMDKLEPSDRTLFERLPQGRATPSPEELGKPVPELHPYWMDRLEKEWLKRFAAGR